MGDLDTWIYAKPAAWESIAPAEDDAWKEWHTVYLDAKTRYWDEFPGGFQVYNVLGSLDQIEAIVAALQLADVESMARIFSWEQGSGLDWLDVNQTIPLDALAVMKSHVTYDSEGNPTGSAPAALSNPNWGHVFFGQRRRIFAGGFSNGFSRGFI